MDARPVIGFALNFSISSYWFSNPLSTLEDTDFTDEFDGIDWDLTETEQWFDWKRKGFLSCMFVERRACSAHEGRRAMAIGSDAHLN